MVKFKCAVCKRRSKKFKDLFFYDIPFYSDERLTLWKKSLNMSKDFRKDDFHICIEHFTPEQFVPLRRMTTKHSVRPLLLETAIPSVIEPKDFDISLLPTVVEGFSNYEFIKVETPAYEGDSEVSHNLPGPPSDPVLDRIKVEPLDYECASEEVSHNLPEPTPGPLTLTSDCIATSSACSDKRNKEAFKTYPGKTQPFRLKADIC